MGIERLLSLDIAGTPADPLGKQIPAEKKKEIRQFLEKNSDRVCGLIPIDPGDPLASGEKIEALKDVNLEVEDEFAPDGRDLGEFRVLLGPSGCGKSTILRMIAGLDFPTQGEVLMNGQRITGPGSDRGMVFQKYTSFAWLTVARNIEYGLALKGTPEAEPVPDARCPVKPDSARIGFSASWPRL